MNIAKVIPMSNFHNDTKNKVLSAEISDFEFHESNLFGKIYDDAEDVGFSILSPSGRTETFYFNDTETDEGSILFWEFLPVNEDLNLRVIIFND